MNKLQKRYKDEIIQQLYKQFNLSSKMQVPHIKKIIINAGLKDAITNSKVIDEFSEELALITGQKPIITKAKKSIASFKLREGMKIGLKVTLRKQKMYDFLDRLINVALPRVRDFRGLSLKSFDNQANYSLGIKEQIIFSEIDYDKIKKIRGFDVSIVTSTSDRDQSFALLKFLGLPFKKTKEDNR